MCGIIGYTGREKKAINVLINGLTHLEYRGYDSAGIAYMSQNELIIVKEKGRIDNLIKKIDFSDLGNIGIGHTRWATHGVATAINSHPHKVGHITLVHNGIIENYSELKLQLIKDGYEFLSETDSEVGAALIDKLYGSLNDMGKAICEFMRIVKGSYALAIICDMEPQTLYAVKKNSPLILGVKEHEKYIASDVMAILDYTNKYIVMDDYEYAKICEDSINLYDINNCLKKYDVRNFEGSNLSISKGGYAHYMLKEINEEVSVLKNVMAIDNWPNILGYSKIVIVGCGSAMHASLVGKVLIEKYLNIPVEVVIASEFRYKPLFLDKNVLVIAVSQSGETADTLEAVKIAKTYNSHTLGIINVKESSIARMVDNVIYTEVGSEIAVATTKAYSAQILVFALLVANSYNGKLEHFKSDLKKLPIMISNIIDDKRKYIDIAKKIKESHDVFFIGRGIDYATSMEGSLKLKEVSYIHSEAYPAGELKHGTISLIEENTPVIGVVSDEVIADKTISNLKEVKARGAYVIYIAADKFDYDSDFYDEKIIVPSINYLLEPILITVLLQLLAYHTAKLKGLDIDKPRNLAKSVTVE